MAEKLTKTALKDELTRRIDWFEKSYAFSPEGTSVFDMSDNPGLLISYGRYLALLDMRWQIQSRLFIDGYCS